MAESAEIEAAVNPKVNVKQGWFRDVIVNAGSLRTAVVLIGGIAIVLVSIGVSIALLGLEELRGELAELRTAISTNAVGGRRTAPPPPPIPVEPVSLKGAQLNGSQTAKVAVLEFSDFQCPFCWRFTLSTYAELKKEYIDTGKVLLAFRHLPLDELHRDARRAAEAAECAGRQGKFWEMHDQLFLDPKRLAPPDLRSHAASVGLRKDEFERCITGEMAGKVDEDAAEAVRLHVYGTPAFLIGTIRPDGRLKVIERFSGAQQVQVFRTVLNRLLGSSG